MLRHRGAADAAVAALCIPVEEFAGLAGHHIMWARQEVEGLAQPDVTHTRQWLTVVGHTHGKGFPAVDRRQGERHATRSGHHGYPVRVGKAVVGRQQQGVGPKDIPIGHGYGEWNRDMGRLRRVERNGLLGCLPKALPQRVPGVCPVGGDVSKEAGLRAVQRKEPYYRPRSALMLSILTRASACALS